MEDKELLFDFLMDTNRLNLAADPDLHYTIYWLNDDKFLIHQDIELRTGKPQWMQDQVYTYSNNYKFEEDKLIELYLGKMNLSFLPDNICDFSNLQKLYVADNILTYVPESIGQLSNLKYLNLRNNQLSNIPETIGLLNNLQELDLSNNQIKDLPKSIANLSNLTTLEIHSNPLPNHTIKDQGSDVQEFLKNL